MLLCDPLWREHQYVYILLLKYLICLQDWLHLSFFYFPHLCSCSLLSRGAAGTSQSPCGEAGTGEVPTFIPERATYHCHSLSIKGINSKSLKFYLLAGAKQ